MLISMKPNREERENLARRIKTAYGKKSLSISEISELSRVDPGQTSRILSGKFKTVSWNVLQICTVLGVDPHGDEAADAISAEAGIAWTKLQESVRRAWDRTPQGAERLVRVIEAVAEIGRR